MLGLVRSESCIHPSNGSVERNEVGRSDCHSHHPDHMLRMIFQ